MNARATAASMKLIGALAIGTACSSSVATPPATTPADAGADASDAAALEDTGTDAGRVTGCPGDTPATYAWAAPVAKQPGACTAAELSALDRAIGASQIAEEKDLRAALGETCSACAISTTTDAAWRGIVLGHDGYIGNVGGCAVLLGAKPACGEAIDHLSTCLIVGCAGCSGAKEQESCSDALTTVDGPCAASLSTMRKICPAQILASAFDTDGECQSLVNTIRLFCGG